MNVRQGLVYAVILCCVASGPRAAQPDDAESRTSIAALVRQAVALENGEGVTKDLLHAYELYCQAAAQGDAAAQYAIGWMYANGRGVLRNDALAALFFRMAAEQGFAQAQAMLVRVGEPAADMPACMQEPVLGPQYSDAPLAEFSPPEPTAANDVPDVAQFVPANASQRQVAELVHRIAPEYQVNPLLALAVIRAESNFDPQARSPRNAQGLMQLIPETSARFNVKKPYDPVQNIRGGLAYLRWLLAYFRGNVALVAAAYNAGEGTVDRYRGVPPYAETRQYVRRIMQMFRHGEHPFDPTVTDPSPELRRIRLDTVQVRVGE